MPEAFIIDAVRTPVTRRGGGLATVHPADLGAHVITALLARAQADPGAVDDVVFGCVDTVGPQAGDSARTAEIAPYGEVTQDEGPRRDTTLEKMAALKPLREGGLITAALSSQISDGAAALLIASDHAVRRYGLRPRARITHLSARG